MLMIREGRENSLENTMDTISRRYRDLFVGSPHSEEEQTQGHLVRSRRAACVQRNRSWWPTRAAPSLVDDVVEQTRRLRLDAAGPETFTAVSRNVWPR